MPDFLVFAARVPKLLGSPVFLYMNEPMPELAETLFGPVAEAQPAARAGRAARRCASPTTRSPSPSSSSSATSSAAPGRRSHHRGAQRLGPRTRRLVAPRPWPRRTTRFTVMCHGAIVDRYGQDTIVEAAALLRDELPDLRVVLTGRGKAVEHVRG